VDRDRILVKLDEPVSTKLADFAEFRRQILKALPTE
jgi:hypothetical protein